MKTIAIYLVACVAVTVLFTDVTWCFADEVQGDGLKDERGIFKMCLTDTSFSLEGRNLRMILAESNGASRQPALSPDTASVFIYDATILCEYRHSIIEGTKIHIENRIQRGGGTGPSPIPTDWETGITFIMVVATTTDQNRFEYAGQVDLIGLKMPCKLKREDVPMVQAAMLKLGEIARTNDCMLSRDEALKLLNINDNYYLWALGATGMAAWNDAAAADELRKRWIWTTKPLLKPRQIVWLDHCFQRFLSEGLRPSVPDRYQMFLEYLQRLDPVSPPTTSPSPWGTPTR